MRDQPRSTRLRDAALAAAQSVLYVFPCVPREKVPAIRGWEAAALDQLVAGATVDQLREQYTKDSPRTDE